MAVLDCAADGGTEKGGELGMKITPEIMVEDEKRWHARDVIAELSYCGNYMRDRKDMTNLDIRFYAYLMRKAHDMLKAQEPRVMTLEELQAIETPWNRNTPPYLFVEKRSSTGSSWMSWEFMHDCVILPGTMGVQNYGSKWRVWNLQPTPEQMRDTPWEGEEIK